MGVEEGLLDEWWYGSHVTVQDAVICPIIPSSQYPLLQTDDKHIQQLVSSQIVMFIDNRLHQSKNHA